jgi:hypothetical protein
MAGKLEKSGFSLTEVLLSVATLAIGMSFIAGVFPVAIYLVTVSTERTTAAIVADEAFAKIELYKVDSTWLSSAPTNTCVDYNDVSLVRPNSDEYFYPSTATGSAGKQYCWSALCRSVGARDVQVTVFVCRKVGGGIVPISPQPVGVSQISGKLRELSIKGDKSLINDGYTLVENSTGDIYRVLERYSSPDNVILLDKQWNPANIYSSPYTIWVVPLPQLGGRYPCVGVFQKVIRF